jgi:hypothetical protein
MRTSLAVMMAAAACAACAPSDAAVRRERLAVQERALLASLDDLQARLLVDRALVAQWKDLAARHESVSAIACTSQEAHATEMAERLMPDEIKDRVLRAGRVQVSSRGGRTRMAAFRQAAADGTGSPAVPAAR